MKLEKDALKVKKATTLICGAKSSVCTTCRVNKSVICFITLNNREKGENSDKTAYCFDRDVLLEDCSHELLLRRMTSIVISFSLDSFSSVK